MKIIKKFLHLVLILLFLFPAVPEKNKVYPDIPRELWDMTGEFEREMDINLKHQKVFIVNLTYINPFLAIYGAIGFCDAKTGNVFLHKPFWETATQPEKEMTYYHELGHCVLNLRHIKYSKNGIDSSDPKDCPMTLMYPSTMHDKCWVKHKDFYFATLRFHYNFATTETQFKDGE